MLNDWNALHKRIFLEKGEEIEDLENEKWNLLEEARTPSAILAQY